MRQRRGGGGGGPQHLQQQQQQQFMHSNASQQRVEEAVLVEQTLASIGQLYGKMSSVIAEQAEQITSIEDDVEAAHTDVLHGREQIGILYEIKKGNRPLILKTYALLIFFIVVMRFYAK
jgi:t-SNARE complex subunit (syntaxin)